VNPTRAILQSSNGSAPEKLAAQLKDAAVAGSADIQRFKKDYQSEDMRELFRKVNAAEITQGQDVWSTDYVALATRLMDDSGSGVQASSEQQSNEDVSDLDVIKQFREQHPTIDVITVNESTGTPCEVTIDDIVFLVEKTEAGYQVQSQGNGKQANLAKRIATYITKQHANTKLQGVLVCCDGHQPSDNADPDRHSWHLTHMLEVRNARSAAKSSITIWNSLLLGNNVYNRWNRSNQIGWYYTRAACLEAPARTIRPHTRR
jgi:hypothetical protein